MHTFKCIRTELTGCCARKEYGTPRLRSVFIKNIGLEIHFCSLENNLGQTIPFHQLDFPYRGIWVLHRVNRSSSQTERRRVRLRHLHSGIRVNYILESNSCPIFNETSPTRIDPVNWVVCCIRILVQRRRIEDVFHLRCADCTTALFARVHGLEPAGCRVRSEEHTSELQSRGHLVCRLLLE